MGDLKRYFSENKCNTFLYRLRKENYDLYFDFKDSFIEFDNCLINKEYEKGFLLIIGLIEDRINICFINFLRYVFENNKWNELKGMNEFKNNYRNFIELRNWDYYKINNKSKIESILSGVSKISVFMKINILKNIEFLNMEDYKDVTEFLNWRNSFIHNYQYNKDKVDNSLLLNCKEIFNLFQNVNNKIKKELNK